MASTQDIQTQFWVWHVLTPMEQKRLLQLALEAAWMGESTLVVVKPSVAFLPLLGGGLCKCGIDPCPPRLKVSNTIYRAYYTNPAERT